MIVDCFTYAGELPMLAYRLSVLEGTADVHVVAEANRTFSGEPRYPSKLVEVEQYVLVDDMPEGPDPWARETHQRNAIDRGLSRIAMRDDDLIVICDADEIPDPAVLLQVAERGPGAWTLVMDGYFWDVEHRVADDHAPKAATFGVYRDRFARSPQKLRDASPALPAVPRAGWHLSYFGNAAWVARKIRTFSHHRELGHHAVEALLEERRASGFDPFGMDRTTYLPLAENPRPPPLPHLLPRMIL